jgi:lipid-A-disaccharide synthase
MKIYIIAGEASGDLHGSNLITALKQHEPDIELRAWGGSKMEKAGATVVKYYHDLAFMGFVEVLKNLIPILKNFKLAKKDILSFAPDYLILIDYPGFNLRMAKWAHKNKIPVIYYILPQIWAWNERRIKYIEKYTQTRLAILPFEQAYYRTKNVSVHYVGHPLVEHIENFKKLNAGVIASNENQTEQKTIIALLPGSRIQEIKKHVPLLIPLVQKNPSLHFELALAPGLPDEMRHYLLDAFPNNFSITENTYHLLSKAKCAVVCSGTATLETALFNVPQIVFYRTNLFNYLIAKLLIKVKYISLVNLILQKPLVTEVIYPINQGKKLEQTFNDLLKMEHQEPLCQGYDEIGIHLGNKKASKICIEFIFNV